jgi:hypothetical protein
MDEIDRRATHFKRTAVSPYIRRPVGVKGKFKNQIARIDQTNSDPYE